jgi:hypothetical protein
MHGTALRDLFLLYIWRHAAPLGKIMIRGNYFFSNHTVQYICSVNELIIEPFKETVLLDYNVLRT